MDVEPEVVSLAHEKPDDLIEGPELIKRKKTDETSLMIEATKQMQFQLQKDNYKIKVIEDGAAAAAAPSSQYSQT